MCVINVKWCDVYLINAFIYNLTLSQRMKKQKLDQKNSTDIKKVYIEN